VWNFKDGRIVMDNCVLAGGGAIACGIRPGQRELSVRLRRNTLLASTILSFTVTDAKNVLESSVGFDPIRFELLENVVAGLDSIRLLDKINEPLPPEEKVAMHLRLPRLFAWAEQENLYSSGHRFIATQPRKLAEWNDFWGQTNTGCQQAAIKFQGGDLVAKRTAGATLVLDDFRIHEGSAGYNTGKDGEDLGADIDLVGPGPAYERWKKAPEYQEWLKETGQMNDRAAAKAKTGAFVVLGSKNIVERNFDTLADAVQRASDGHTIEIRGNGPFVTEPVRCNHALTIRAAKGFQPVIKLSPAAVQARSNLLESQAPLVLEGLVLQLMAEIPDDRQDPWQEIVRARAPLYMANCRLLMKQRWGRVMTSQGPICDLRNCEIFCSASLGTASYFTPDVLVNVSNCCSLAEIGMEYVQWNSADYSRGSTVRLTRNSFVTLGWPFRIRVYPDKVPGLWTADQRVQPVRLETDANIWDARSGVVLLAQRPPGKMLSPREAETSLPQILDWRGARNLYSVDGPFLGLTREAPWERLTPENAIRTLTDWNQFWGMPEPASVEGRAVYQGGDLLSKFAAVPEELTAEDFRLRRDSTGFGALEGGKDIGADIKFVGPGPAYERWKKTPEYQQWLKETAQVK